MLHELDVQNLDASRQSPLAELVGLDSDEKASRSASGAAGAAYKRVFLQSLFTGDGSSSLLPRNTIQISYSTYSEQLAKDVQRLLLEFGVVSRLCRYAKGEMKVVITNRRDARRFVLDVGFLGAKQAKLEARSRRSRATSTARATTTSRTSPGTSAASAGRAGRQGLAAAAQHRPRRALGAGRHRDPGAHRLHEVKAVIEPLVTSECYYAEVASVDDAGVQPVYSLRVDSEDHSFLANGFVSHNTEARLSQIATELLRDIDADTVDFEPNYDESRRQPSVLPSRFPNLLVNGSTGIAVGMATNMPPHHLGETIDAVVAMIDNPDIDVEGLMKHVKGPDFPTGAIIVGRSGIRDAYRTGRGRVVMRARAHIEELRGGKSAIVISELPYGVKKGGDSGVIRKIADLVQEKVITEVSDLADHSDRTGMRIHVELKRDAVPQVALNKLFKHTPLQSTFGYNAVALVDGVPKTLSLLELVTHYLDFQREIVIRRSKDELHKKERARPRSRGLPHRARQHRRDHRADSRRRRHRRRAHAADRRVRALRDPGAGDPRHAARAPHRRSSARRSRPSTRTCRSASPSCARSSAIPRASTGSSARSCSRSSRCTARATTAAPRSCTPRRSSSSRT